MGMKAGEDEDRITIMGRAYTEAQIHGFVATAGSIASHVQHMDEVETPADALAVLGLAVMFLTPDMQAEAQRSLPRYLHDLMLELPQMLRVARVEVFHDPAR